MTQQKLNDKWFRFIGVPFIAFMGHIVFYNRNESGEEVFGFWTIYLFSLAETLLLWECIRLVILYFRNKYPSLQQTRKRVSRMLIGCCLITIVLRTLNILLYDATKLWGYKFPLEAYLHSIFVALLFVIIVGGVYETVYYFYRWKDMAVEAETLKKENLQTQLDSLKTQISPHFLFNSLGSLSSLVVEDPKKAQQFVDEMSSVYRYLLQASDQALTTLRNEMNFVAAYMHMLRTRFPEGLQLVTAIDSRYYDYYLPPLTLQILLENAVKHNAVLASQPLYINIGTDGQGNLVVVNNIQQKTSPVQSSKKGLSHIQSKYKLLKQPEITIQHADAYFRVTVPLIKSIYHAGINR
jgi:hypothetical protein